MACDFLLSDNILHLWKPPNSVPRLVCVGVQDAQSCKDKVALWADVRLTSPSALRGLVSGIQCRTPPEAQIGPKRPRRPTDRKTFQKSWCCRILSISTVQSRTGLRNRLSEPASRRFLVPALRAGPGAKFLKCFAAPPPAWRKIQLVLRNHGLGPSPG